MCQQFYAQYILARFGMMNCNPSFTFMDEGIRLQANMKLKFIDYNYYQNLVSSLNWLTQTRLDLSYVVNHVSRYMNVLQQTHLEAAKKKLKYIKRTPNFGIFFSHEATLKLGSFVDSNGGHDIDERCSTTKLLFKLGSNMIIWSSKLQPMLALSTIEIEYHALVDGAKEVA